MLYISNRGNQYTKLSDQENTFSYVAEAITQNIDVKVDLWVKDDLYYLGNDEAKDEVDFSFFINYANNLWVQCRNKESLEKMRVLKQYLNYFWDEGNKDFIVTSKGYIISLGKENVLLDSIYFLGDNEYNNEKCQGICCDKIMTYVNQ